MPRLNSAKQEKFAQHYALHDKPSEAYRHAYDTSRMKPNTIYVKASQLLKNGKVQIRIKELREIASKQAEEQFKVDADYLLKRFVEVDQMDVADILEDDGSIKAVREWPKVWRTSLVGMDVAELFAGTGNDRVSIGQLKKIKWLDKAKNLEMLGRHVDVQAFKDKVEHSVGKSLQELLAEVRDGGAK